MSSCSDSDSREQKIAEYRDPEYESVLATKGFSMNSSLSGVTAASKGWCKDLLDQEQEYPENTLFQDHCFEGACEDMRNENDEMVIRDIGLLVVPSAKRLRRFGATGLKCLTESVDNGWTSSIPITETRLQPDYSVGFGREAFTRGQLDRMKPIVGDFNDQSYYMATGRMYFPFLTCEVSTEALDIADRRNAHSGGIAVRAVVELFRAVKREKELHGEILAFSISHDHRSVRIYGYYAEIDSISNEAKYFRHLVHAFDFTALEGKERWTAYRFTKNVYDNWMPEHLKRICSAVDDIPADISFSA